MDKLHYSLLNSNEQEYSLSLDKALDFLATLDPDTYFLYGSVGEKHYLPETRISRHQSSFASVPFIDLDLAFDSRKYCWEDIREISEKIRRETTDMVIVDPHVMSGDEEYAIIKGIIVPRRYLTKNYYCREEGVISVLDLRGNLLIRSIKGTRVEDIDKYINILINAVTKERIDKDYIQFLITNSDKTIFRQLLRYLKHFIILPQTKQAPSRHFGKIIQNEFVRLEKHL